MKNFQFEYNKKTYWYSRSLVAINFVFCFNKNRDEWCVLANQRGPGCPSCVGLWTVPCGYIDFNESITEAAIRETKEECGVFVNTKHMRFVSLFTEPRGKKQNMSVNFCTVLPGDVFDYMVSDEFNEPDETMDIEWIPMSKLDEYKFAYNQKPSIRKLYNTFVQPNWWQKIMLKIHDLTAKHLIPVI